MALRLFKGYHVRKGDMVEVLAGKEKGKTGKILKVLKKKNRVIVEKINFVKKHAKPGGKFAKGGIVEMEAPLHISNVALFCSHCSKGVRYGTKVLDDGKKVRICKVCGEQID
jgi:large subunit ribosomal protein L24